MTSVNVPVWAVVPAAGVGARMGGELPKQYLPLAGKTILERTLERLLLLPNLQGLMVALGETDDYWQSLPVFQDPRVKRVAGGAERSASVLNGLKALAADVDADSWILVHDAVRPCVRSDDILRLVDAVQQHPAGGILASPVIDTLKQQRPEGDIDRTVDRSGLWRALTPQVFRLGVLADALERTQAEQVSVTDEASAVEWLGMHPLIVEGQGDNIKITHPADLPLAEFILARQ